MVLTDLHNFAMPLIRYDTGDLAVAQPSPCECGRGFPLVTVEGRSHEALRGPEGKMVTPRQLAVALSKCLDPGTEYQLLQEASDRVRLVLVPRAELSDATAALLRRTLRAMVDGECQVFVETTGQIASEPSGKRPTVKRVPVV